MLSTRDRPKFGVAEVKRLRAHRGLRLERQVEVILCKPLLPMLRAFALLFFSTKGKGSYIFKEYECVCLYSMCVCVIAVFHCVCVRMSN